MHIHPAVVRFTFNTFGDDHVILIADSMMACGLPDGQYSLGGQAVTVHGRRATLTEQEGTIAGSATCLFDCMKRAVQEMGVPLESAVRAATLNPARSIGVDADYGSLEAGRWGQRGTGGRPAEHPDRGAPRPDSVTAVKAAKNKPGRFAASRFSFCAPYATMGATSKKECAPMKKIAILGCGQLGSIVADAIASGLLPDYTLCAAMSRKLPDAEALCAKAGGAACVTLGRGAGPETGLRVETAAVQGPKESCLPVLEAGLGFIPISIGAFADADFYAKACAAAKAHGGRIYLPHGAVGGFDVLHTVALMAKAKNQPITAEIHTHKGPASLKNTPLFTEELMTTPEKTVLAGTAAEAIQVLPTKVNVAVAAALASIGPDAMGAKNYQRGRLAGDDHCITMETDGLKVTSDIYSRTAEIAGWSIVSLLQNLASPVVLF